MHHKLIALPTPDTLELLHELMAAAPLRIEFESMFVEIGTSATPIKVRAPTETYSATTLGANVWYETATGSSYLLLPLQAGPDLLARANEIGDVFGRTRYIPYLVACRDPVMRRHRKAWINSVASSLALHPRVLTFHGELVVADQSTVPAHADFYQDFATSSFL